MKVNRGKTVVKKTKEEEEILITILYSHTNSQRRTTLL